MPGTAPLPAAVTRLVAQWRAGARFPTRAAGVGEGVLQTGLVALAVGELLVVVRADPVSPAVAAATVAVTGAVLFARRVWPGSTTSTCAPGRPCTGSSARA